MNLASQPKTYSTTFLMPSNCYLAYIRLHLARIVRFDQRRDKMLNLSANEAKTNFGEALMKSQRQPVQISKYGKPAAMLISMEDYAELEELKLEILRLRVARAEMQ